MIVCGENNGVGACTLAINNLYASSLQFFAKKSL